MKLQSITRVASALGFVLAISSVAEAQATRTWVSGVGDDVNPCSRTAPCKTFAGAISKTATGGYINVLDPGGFGAVTITKSITIDGGPFHAGIIVGGGNGININSSTAKVTIRNIDIEGTLSGGVLVGNIGINVISAASVHIEHVNIVNFASFGVNHNPSGAGALLFIDNSTFRNVHSVQVINGRANINNTRWEGTAKGVFAGANALVTVKNSMVSGAGEGVATSAASAIINLDGCTMTNNTFGVTAAAGGTVRLGNTAVLSNSNTGLFNDGSSFIVSMGGNMLQGNPTPGSFTSSFSQQ
jgi:hypothetical protein